MNDFLIGQRVIYSKTICTVIASPEGREHYDKCGTGVWIFDPSVGYERLVSDDNVKPLPNGQL